MLAEMCHPASGRAGDLVRGMLMSQPCGLVLSNSIGKPSWSSYPSQEVEVSGGVQWPEPPHSEAGCISTVSLEKQLKIAMGDVPLAARCHCQA